MPLTATAVKALKPSSRQQKHYDEKGLLLIVAPNGGKWWRLKYRFGGKEKMLSLGAYPAVSLKDASEARDACRAQLAQGLDPSAEKQADKARVAAEQTNTLQAVSNAWMVQNAEKWSNSHAGIVRDRLEKNVFPYLGARPVRELDAADYLVALRRIESRGAVETAHRVRQYLNQIYRFAIASRLADSNPVADLVGALKARPKKENYAAILEPKKVGELLRTIDGYSGHFATCAALKLAPYLFVRPGNLRAALWTDFDLDECLWRLPAERMKMKNDHLVPLSRQAVALLKDIQPVTGDGQYVFPSIRSTSRPMSENTLNAALRRLGYSKTEMTSHGFRSMAATLLTEKGYNPDVIERQLAHVEQNHSKAAYNRAEHLPERVELMQEWADYLDGLRAGGEVVPFRHSKQSEGKQ